MMRPAPYALGLALLACSGNPTPEDAAPAGHTPAITLERGACFGRCPVYELAISSSGVVRYLGKANVDHIGLAEDTIAVARVDSLIREFDRAGYFDLADDYVLDAPACGRYSTDSPSVTTSLAAGSRRKQVRHDYGCSGAPPVLARLESRIDQVAGSSRWTGR